MNEAEVMEAPRYGPAPQVRRGPPPAMTPYALLLLKYLYRWRNEWLTAAQVAARAEISQVGVYRELRAFTACGWVARRRWVNTPVPTVLVHRLTDRGAAEAATTFDDARRVTSEEP